MNRKLYFPTVVALLLGFAFTVCSCGGDDNTPVYTFPDDPNQPADEFVTRELSGYPAGLKVFSFTDNFSATEKCSGFIAIADPGANAKLRFNAVLNGTMQTPSQIHAAYASQGRGAPQVTVNGGYFYGGASLSLLVTDGVMKSVENQIVSRTGPGGGNVNVYAVRSAFGQMPGGEFEAQWIYCASSDNNKPYAYPSPLGNDEQSKAYMPAPADPTTDGGVLWEPQEAVGGGPMLVKDGKNVAVTNYWKECFDGGGIAGLSRQPRTAAGVAADGKIVLLVCDGRNMNGSKGYTLAELAGRLIQQGVVNGINFDGGGSSAMIGREGTVLNRPSDSGQGGVTERAVKTAIVLTLAE